MRPGACRGKGHKRANLGYTGRRVLVSRRWSGKTLTDHRHDQRTWVLAQLGTADPDEDSDPGHYLWQPLNYKDPDLLPLTQRLLRGIAWRLRDRNHPPDGNSPPQATTDAHVAA